MVSHHRSLALCVSLTSLAFAGCGTEPGPIAAVEAPIVESDAPPDGLAERLADLRGCSARDLDHVYTLHHHVRVGRGRSVHVTERFTLRAFLRRERRGALLLPGPLSLGSFFEIDVDGYRFQSDLAREGLFTFAPDYEGTGESSQPDDGLSADHAFLVDEEEVVLRAMRNLRHIGRMDIVGESTGGAIAAELCADSARVRSCTLSSMSYVEITPFAQAVFLDPGFIAFLSSQPNGYLDAAPPFYFNIVAGTTPDVSAAILATQPGIYAVAPLLSPTTLPWFDPTHARVPALIVMGTLDNIAEQIDADLLADAWGSARRRRPPATIVRLEGAGHLPRIEPEPTRSAYYDAVVAFLDP
jgi:alpha-beta hydrolase superfamily lysophospholipase